MSSSPPRPPRPPSPFTQDDVLYGREDFCQVNGGNVRLRQLILQFFNEYEAADQKTAAAAHHRDRDGNAGANANNYERSKQDINALILAQMKATGARFLRRSKDGMWEEVSESAAKRKITDGFKTIRDRLKRHTSRRAAAAAAADAAAANHQPVQQGAQQQQQLSFGVTDSAEQPEPTWECKECRNLNSNESFLCEKCEGRRYDQEFVVSRGGKKRSSVRPPKTSAVVPKQLPVVTARTAGGGGDSSQPPSSFESPSPLNFTHVFVVLDISNKPGTKQLVEEFSDTVVGLRNLMLFGKTDFDETVRRCGVGHVPLVLLGDFRLWFQTCYLRAGKEDKPVFTKSVWDSFRERVNGTATKPEADLPTTTCDGAAQPLGEAADGTSRFHYIQKEVVSDCPGSPPTVAYEKNDAATSSPSKPTMLSSEPAKRLDDPSVSFSFNGVEVETESITSSRVIANLADLAMDKTEGRSKRSRLQAITRTESSVTDASHATPAPKHRRQEVVADGADQVGVAESLLPLSDDRMLSASTISPSTLDGSSLRSGAMVAKAVIGMVSTSKAGSTSSTNSDIDMESGAGDMTYTSSGKEKNELSGQGGQCDEVDSVSPDDHSVPIKETHPIKGQGLSSPTGDHTALQPAFSNEGSSSGKSSSLVSPDQNSRDSSQDSQIGSSPPISCTGQSDTHVLDQMVPQPGPSVLSKRSTTTRNTKASSAGTVVSTTFEIGSCEFTDISSLTPNSNGLSGGPPALPLRGGGVPTRPSPLLERLPHSKVRDVQQKLRLMKEQPDNKELQAYLCGDLSLWLQEHDAKTFGTIEKVVGRWILDQVLQTMRDHFSCPNIFKLALEIVDVFYRWGIGRLARRTSRKLVKVCASEMMKQQLHYGPVVQANACFALGVVAQDHSPKTSTALEKTIPLVLSAMRQLLCRHAVVENGCLALSRMIWSRESISMLVTNNGILLIVEAMQQFASSIDIQKSCCKVLATVAKNSRENVFSDLRARAITCLLAALHLNSTLQSDASIQMDCCSAMVELACDDEHCKKIIVELGISVVRSVGQPSSPDNGDDEKGREHICLLLERVAAHLVECCRMVADALESDLQLPSSSLDLKENVDALVRPLLQQIDSDDKRIVEGRTVVALLEFIRHQKVSEDACTVLCALAQKSSSALRLILNAVSQDMERDLYDTDAQRNGLYLLGKLWLMIPYCDAADWFFFADCIPSVAKAVEFHKQISEIQESGCCLLSSLSINRDFQRHIVEEGGISSVVGSMKVHVHNIEIQESGCHLLSSLSINRDFQQHIVEEGGISSVVASMEVRLHNIEIQERACCVLSMLSIDHDLRWNLVEEGAVLSMVNSMRVHLGNVQIQEYGCHMLNLLSLASGDYRRIIVEAGSVPLVSGAIARHLSHAKIQKHGFSLFESLAVEMQHNRAILDAKGVEGILKAMQHHHVSDTPIENCGCYVLSLLSAADGALRQRIVEAEGILAVWTAMQRHSSHSKIQEYGCSMFRSLSINFEDHSAILDGQGVEVMIAAVQQSPSNFLSSSLPAAIMEWMRQHWWDPLIQQQGCFLLHEMAGRGQEGREAALRSSGAIQAILMTMDRCTSTASKVYSQGCLSLCKMANVADPTKCKTIVDRIIVYRANNKMFHRRDLEEDNPDNDWLIIHSMVAWMEQRLSDADIQVRGLETLGRMADGRGTFLVNAGGIPTVVAAMKRHCSNGKVQEKGCFALARLAEFGKENEACQQIVVEGGISIVVAAMKRHRSHAKVQDEGCFALTRLAEYGKENKACQQVVAEGGISIVVAAMKRHQSHAKVQKAGCFALAGLAEYGKENKACQQIVAEGGISIVVAAMKRHRSHAEVQKAGCFALACLGTYIEENKACQQIVAKGGISIVVAAMQRHRSHAKVQKAGCFALAGLAEYGKENKASCQQIVAEGGISVLVAAMKQHRTESCVQHWGCWVFENLAKYNPECHCQIREEGGIAVIQRSKSNLPLGLHFWANDALRALGEEV